MNVDSETQKFIEEAQQKAMIMEQIHKLFETCFDKCIDKPRDTLDHKSETCLTNCVERFIDTTRHITQRLQRNMGH